MWATVVLWLAPMLGAEPQAHVTLPPAPERDWLIARTAELVASLGHVGYVRAPLLEPTPEFFPDAWAGGEASVRRVLLRLLRWADAACAPERGLGELDVEVVLHPSDPARRRDVIGQPPPLRGQDPKAWFVRLDTASGESGVAHFAVEEIALREPDNLVPELARAVAHCVRATHGLPTPLDVAGQRLIDITTFPLGFGLLTTDACVRFHTRASGGFRSTRAESRVGALGIQDMSFLLGLQTHVRALDRRARKRVLAHLQPNQAEFVGEAWHLLETADRLGKLVREQLGVPPPDRWPAARPLAVLLGPPISTRPRAPADAEDDDEDALDDESPAASATIEQRRDLDPGIVGLNAGKPVFRIERNAALRMAKLLGVPILLLGGLLSRGSFGVDLPMHIVMPSAAALALLGLGVGSFFTDRRCSEPKCSRALDVDDEVCPLCGGTVMGVIHDARERLGAEEELVRQGKVGPDGMLIDRGETDGDETA